MSEHVCILAQKYKYLFMFYNVFTGAATGAVFYFLVLHCDMMAFKIVSPLKGEIRVAFTFPVSSDFRIFSFL